MATVIQLKRNSTSGTRPTTSSITSGELCVNLTDGIAFSTNGSVVFELGANNTNVNITGNATIKGIVAGGSIGSNGQYLTSNGTSVSWATVSGGGATLTANATDTQTYYLGMSNAVSGSWTNAVIDTTHMNFVPSTGTLSVTIFNSLSDINFKKNIKPIKKPLTTINKMNGVSFEWKHYDEKSYGVIAQDLEKILPELVSETDGRKSVNYLAIIGFLIEGIKELDKRVKILEQK